LPDIFLSYSRDDQAIARRFAEGFELAGLSVWWDAALNPGEAYDKVTEKALEEAKAVVVLWSKKSVDSRWVRSEATQANSTGTLVPVMIESCKRPVMFELTHTADLSGWKGDTNDPAWQTFLAGVRRFVDKDASPQTARATVPVKRRFNPLAIAIPLSLLLITGAVLLWVKYKPSVLPESATQTAATANTQAAREATLAVLPFVNMSSDPEQEYFADGLSEELLNQLAQIPDLRVTARTSSFAFKGKNQDARAIGNALDVANILEGSVRKDGTKLKITAQLIDATTGTHLFSQTFDREMVDIFRIQEEIAKSVASSLSVKLGVGQSTLGKGGTTNVEAYEKYLRGMALKGEEKRETILKSVQLLREAVALDPTFADAWGQLYVALSFVVVFVPGEQVAARREMEEARNRINALAPNSQLALNLRAADFMQHRQWGEAERTMLSSAKPDQGLYSILLSVTGRTTEAIAILERGWRADPLSASADVYLLLLNPQAGHARQAQDAYERIKERGGLNGYVAWNQLRALMKIPGTPVAVIEAQFREYLKFEDQPMELDVFLVERLGDRKAALEAIRKAFDHPDNQNISRLHRITHYADYFGDRDLALAALRRQMIDLSSSYVTYMWEPHLTGIRTDPRFKVLVRELGLADYYRTSGKWSDYCKPVGKDDFECR